MAESQLWEQFDNATKSQQAESPLWADFDKSNASSDARRIADVGVDVAKGVVGLGESMVGLADLVSFGAAGRAMDAIGYDPKATKAVLSDLYSSQRKAANQRVEDAEGFFGTAASLFSNPSVLAGVVTESIPSTLGIAAAGKMLATRVYETALKAATASGATAEIAKQVGIKAVQDALPRILTTVGAAEGAQAAGSIAQQARQEGREWADYVLPAMGAGVSTALITKGAGTVAGKIGLGGDLETAIAAGIPAAKTAGGVVARTAKGAVREGALEEMPQSTAEQAFQNVALGKPADEGLGEAAATGLLTGKVMGGAHAAITGAPQTAQQPTPPQPRIAGLLPPPAPIQVTPEGVAGTPQQFDEMGLTADVRRAQAKIPAILASEDVDAAIATAADAVATIDVRATVRGEEEKALMLRNALGVMERDIQEAGIATAGHEAIGAESLERADAEARGLPDETPRTAMQMAFDQARARAGLPVQQPAPSTVQSPSVDKPSVRIPQTPDDAKTFTDHALDLARNLTRSSTAREIIDAETRRRAQEVTVDTPNLGTTVPSLGIPVREETPVAAPVTPPVIPVRESLPNPLGTNQVSAQDIGRNIPKSTRTIDVGNGVTLHRVGEIKTEEGTFSAYDTERNPRGRATMFTVHRDPGGYIVRNAIVPDGEKRKGLATALYRAMNDESIQNTGNPIRSTQPRTLTTGETVHELSPDAVALWDSFVQKGLAEKISDKNYRFLQPQSKQSTVKPAPVTSIFGTPLTGLTRQQLTNAVKVGNRRVKDAAQAEMGRRDAMVAEKRGKGAPTAISSGATRTPVDGMQERAVRSDETGSPEPAQIKGEVGGRWNVTPEAIGRATAAALVAANKEATNLAEHDVAKELQDMANSGVGPDIRDLSVKPEYWDTENETLTTTGQAEYDRRADVIARDRAGHREFTDLSDLDGAHQFVQRDAMEKILDELGIHYEIPRTWSTSRYIEVTLPSGETAKIRFADHANQVRDTTMSADINVAPGEATFSDAVEWIRKRFSPFANSEQPSSVEAQNLGSYQQVATATAPTEQAGEGEQIADKGVAMYSRVEKDDSVVGETSTDTPAIVQALNDKMADDLNDDKWRNAYALAQPGTTRNALAQAIKETFGKDVVMLQQTSAEVSGFAGMSYGGTIYVNTSVKRAGFVQIAGHELLHEIKKDTPALYDWFAKQAESYIIEGAEGRYLSKLEMAGAKMNVREEILADFTGDALADPAFLRTLAEASPSKFKQFLNAAIAWFRSVASRLSKGGYGSSEYFTDVEAMRRHLVSVLVAYAKRGESGIADAGPAEFSRADQTDTDEFKRWFGASKVVDPDGKPLVVYHGTTADFTEFDAGKAGRNSRHPTARLGFWFSESPKVADLFNEAWDASTWPPTRTQMPNANTVSVYLSIKNPYILTVERFREINAQPYGEDVEREQPEATAKTRDWIDKNKASLLAKGYDGIKVEGDPAYAERMGGEEYSAAAWVAFRPEQIKSAIGNRGTFDPRNPDIRFSRVGNRATWDAEEPGKLDTFIRVLQDKQIDTKRVIQAIKNASGALADSVDVYLQEELFHGRAAKAVQDFLDAEMTPLLKEMSVRGVTMPELEEYLHARHAEERNEQIAKINPDMPDGGSGMTTKDANSFLAKLDSQKRKAYEALAKRVSDINDKTRQELVSYGLESPATIRAWGSAYQNYVPLHREDMDGGPGTGQGFSVKGPASKRATGSRKKVVEILANIAMQRERAIVRGEKNRVANALIGLAEANPNPDFWKVDKPPTIKVVDERTGLVAERVDPLYKNRENVIIARIPDAKGEIVEHSVMFNERDERASNMVAALKNLDAHDLGEVLSASAKITRYFASINTQYNPVFGVVNLTRDTQGALLNLSTTPIAGKQWEVLRHTMSALKGIYFDQRAAREGKQPQSQWAALWDEFQKEGGQTGFRDMFRTSKDRAEAIDREIKRVSEGKAQQFGRAIFDWLSDYNTAMENAVRLASYRVAKESGISKQRAASLAKNLTVNFNRKGQIGVQAGSLYAFFNASVQGTARLAETLSGPMGKKIIVGGLLLGSAQAVLLAAAGFDDDEPPDFVRERSLILPIGDKKYLTLPMPLGLHVIPNLARIPTEYALSGFKDPGKRISQFVNLLADAFNPVGNAGLSLQTISPSAIDPIAALAENKDWTGKPIAREDFNKLAPTPGHARAKDTATQFSKTVSKALNWMSGGTEYKPGLFSPTPDQIDYLVGQVTGGLGREALKAEQTVTSAFTGEELPTYKIPLLGRFYGNAEGQAGESQKFYNSLREINEHEAEIKGRAKAGEPVADYIAENPEARLWKAANTYERRVSLLRRRKRELVSKDADAETVKAIDQQITATMQRFNELAEGVKK